MSDAEDQGFLIVGVGNAEQEGSQLGQRGGAEESSRETNEQLQRAGFLDSPYPWFLGDAGRSVSEAASDEYLAARSHTSAHEEVAPSHEPDEELVSAADTGESASGADQDGNLLCVRNWEPPTDGNLSVSGQMSAADDRVLNSMQPSQAPVQAHIPVQVSAPDQQLPGPGFVCEPIGGWEEMWENRDRIEGYQAVLEQGRSLASDGSGKLWLEFGLVCSFLFAAGVLVCVSHKYKRVSRFLIAACLPLAHVILRPEFSQWIVFSSHEGAGWVVCELFRSFFANSANTNSGEDGLWGVTVDDVLRLKEPLQTSEALCIQMFILTCILTLICGGLGVACPRVTVLLQSLVVSIEIARWLTQTLQSFAWWKDLDPSSVVEQFLLLRKEERCVFLSHSSEESAGAGAGGGGTLSLPPLVPILNLIFCASVTLCIAFCICRCVRRLQNAVVALVLGATLACTLGEMCVFLNYNLQPYRTWRVKEGPELAAHPPSQAEDPLLPREEKWAFWAEQDLALVFTDPEPRCFSNVNHDLLLPTQSLRRGLRRGMRIHILLQEFRTSDAQRRIRQALETIFKTVWEIRDSGPSRKANVLSRNWHSLRM